MITLDKEEELWHLEELLNKHKARIKLLENFIAGDETEVTIKGKTYAKLTRLKWEAKQRERNRFTWKGFVNAIRGRSNS